MTAVQNQRTLFGDTIDQQFISWLVGNATAVSRFVVLAKEQRDRGRTVSAKAIWERMRWDDDTLGHLNNNFTSRIARYVMREWPELDGYFRTRELRAR